MNKPEDINKMLQSCIFVATMYTTYAMLLELLFALIPGAKDRIKQVLDHEPTNENWDDYCQYLGELHSIPKCVQRAEDRKKLRRLVFGDDGTT